MASIDRADPVVLGHLLAQHRELHDLLLEAHGAFAAEAERAGARERLVALREHLARHFVQEERGGFLEESLTRMPRLAADVKSVLADHPRLLAELDGLLDRIAARDIGGESWRQAGRDFEAFTRHLLAHERSENAVLQEGYNEDLGLVD